MTPSAEIIKVLDYLGQKIGVTIDWTQANIMPYLQELFRRFIMYEIATTTADIVLVTLLFIAGLCCIKPFKKNFSESYDDGFAMTICIVCGAMTAFGFLFFICVVPDSIYHLIECLTIPEKTLYEYVSTLMK